MLLEFDMIDKCHALVFINLPSLRSGNQYELHKRNKDDMILLMSIVEYAQWDGTPCRKLANTSSNSYGRPIMPP